MQRDVFCSLISWFAVCSIFSNLFFSFFGLSSDAISWAHWDFIIRVFIALGPFEGVLLLYAHSSK